MDEPNAPTSRPLLARIFLTPDEPRLRSGWRLALQTLGLILLLFCIGVPLGILIALLPIEPDDTLWLVLSGVIEIFAVTVSVFLARKFLDRRSITSLGLKLDTWAAADVLAGILITFVMMGAIYLFQLALGWLAFEGFAWQFESVQTVLSNALLMLAVFVLVGWNEELLSRGYHLQTLASGTNLLWGVVISSAIFGLLHHGNPNATWISDAGIFLAGLFLASGYLTTRQLWLSIGLHIGWNFFEGFVFGFPVSGMEVHPMIHISVTGPQIWTGGAFGPEAGLVVLPGLALGTALVLFYTRFLRETIEA